MNKNLDDEIKKHSRTSPGVQFKEFSLTTQKLDLERTSELGNAFLKKTRSKKFKIKLKINIKKPHVNKIPLVRKKNLVQTKTNENPSRKIRSKNREKTDNIKVKLPHVNKNPLPRKQNFVQTPFSYSALKLD